jgi:hypothetical protein
MTVAWPAIGLEVERHGDVREMYGIQKLLDSTGRKGKSPE